MKGKPGLIEKYERKNVEKRKKTFLSNNLKGKPVSIG